MDGLCVVGGAELQKVETVTSVNIDQLLPNTNYTFYVVAYNNESASNHSKPITQVTDEDSKLYLLPHCCDAHFSTVLHDIICCMKVSISSLSEPISENSMR